jgi:3-deoxy-D-manno-octulosonic acid kinase
VKRALQGFGVHTLPGGVRLYVRRGLEEAVRSAGLDDPQTWGALLARGRRGSGRGATARLDLEAAGPVVLKRMRRGGVLAPVWRDRYPGLARLEANLRLPLEALRRGVPTAEPAAMLLLSGPPGLYQAWLAMREIPAAADLLALLAAGPVPPPVLETALQAVRTMHDRGIEHADLNLGNVLVQDLAPGLRGFVVDLDRARLHPGPVSASVRDRGLARLVRSYRKNFGERGPLGPRPTEVLRAAYRSAPPPRG